jgi:hypothetical protein
MPAMYTLIEGNRAAEGLVSSFALFKRADHPACEMSRKITKGQTLYPGSHSRWMKYDPVPHSSIQPAFWNTAEAGS